MSKDPNILPSAQAPEAIEILSNESGLSLIEVMIAGAIMVVLSLGMAGFMRNASNDVKRVETKGNFTQVGGAVRATASQPTSVLNTVQVVE